MSTADSVAITALVVSLVALLTTLGQLLQQYFATADGYRRCQRSVMGDWAKRTRRRWRWREFRFETRYAVPVIYMARFDGLERETEGDPRWLLLGDEDSRINSMTPYSGSWFPSDIPSQKPVGKTKPALPGSSSEFCDSDELVGWLPFLHWAHSSTRASMSEGLSEDEIKDLSKPIKEGRHGRRVPAVKIRERSWDFQLPDVVRPLATTTIGDIATIVRRMGMWWKDFRPEEGILRAEGSAQVITSTTIRGLGLVINYNHTGRTINRPKFWKSRLTREDSTNSKIAPIYIPSARADRLGFGILRGITGLGLDDYDISTQQEITETLYKLETTGTCAKELREKLEKNPAYCYPVADLVALVTPTVAPDGCNLTYVPAPSDNVLGNYIDDDRGPELLQKLRHFINKLWSRDESGHSKMHWVSRHITLVETFLKARKEGQDPSGQLQEIIQMHLKCGKFLEKYPIKYPELLSAHLLTAKEHGFSIRDKRDTQAFHIDDKYIEDFAANCLRERPQTDYEEEKDIARRGWILMMFKGILWWACHDFDEGERVPAKYYGSSMRVWIS